MCVHALTVGPINKIRMAGDGSLYVRRRAYRALCFGPAIIDDYSSLTEGAVLQGPKLHRPFNNRIISFYAHRILRKNDHDDGQLLIRFQSTHRKHIKIQNENPNHRGRL